MKEIDDRVKECNTWELRKHLYAYGYLFFELCTRVTSYELIIIRRVWFYQKIKSLRSKLKRVKHVLDIPFQVVQQYREMFHACITPNFEDNDNIHMYIYVFLIWIRVLIDLYDKIKIWYTLLTIRYIQFYFFMLENIINNINFNKNNL